MGLDVGRPYAQHPSGADSHADSRKTLSDERVGAAIDAKILVVKDSSAARGLHQLAACRRYDLLVVGSCHRGALARHTRCPLVVFPRSSLTLICLAVI